MVGLDHGLHPSLLKHDLRKPDSVGVRLIAPGKIPTDFVVPREYPRSQRTAEVGRVGHGLWGIEKGTLSWKASVEILKESDTDSQNHKWDSVLEAAILNLLGTVGQADLDGLLHVLQREKIRVNHEALSQALGRLSERGQVRIELGADHNPVVHLERPFVGWT
jgi:hypothetical protein